ncbi:hypothetical protein D3C73_1150410 [compost metagenome]
MRSDLDQGDVHVVWLDAIQTISGQLMSSVVQFGSQFHTGCTRTDNRHADFLIFTPRVGAQIMVEQLLMEALGLFTGVKE